jgi:hypothetical protein
MHGGNEAGCLDGIAQRLANLAQTDFQDRLAHRHPGPDSREQHLFGDQLPSVGYQVLQHSKSLRGEGQHPCPTPHARVAWVETERRKD